MAFLTPPEIATEAVEAGVKKAAQSPGRLLVGGALAGAFIAFGGLLGISVTSGMNPAIWGTTPQLINGAVFSFGLMMVVIGGAELVTGVFSLVVMAAIKKRISWASVASYTVLTSIGAFAGALFVAYFLGVKSGILEAPPQFAKLSAVATAKGVTETDWQIFLRGIGCNWLVCMAIWLSLGAKDIGGKILAIFFPITAFVAMGMEHFVANMFFLPAAIFADVPGIGWSDAGRNLLFAGLGNAVGATVFVALAYTYLYGSVKVPAVTAGVGGPIAPATTNGNGTHASLPEGELVGS